MMNGVNTIIISPRRWGKSSLVEHVVRRLRKNSKKLIFIEIDLFGVRSEPEFLTAIAKKCINASSSKLRDLTNTVREFFRHLIPKIVFNTEAGDVSLEFDMGQLETHKEEILDLPETLAQRKGVQVIVCIDEFQNIRNYKSGIELERILRAHWQRHRHVSYCLYGSKRHMMSEIFNSSSNPFYRFGDIMLLPKIEERDWIRFIVKKFEKDNKMISKEQAALIAHKMDNHPWYVQQLAHYTWVSTNDIVTDVHIEFAYDGIEASQIPFFQETIDSLSNTQVNLLKAILAGEGQLTSTSVMKKYQVGTPNNVRKNIVVLENRDIIDRNGSYTLLDPVFKNWITKRIL